MQIMLSKGISKSKFIIASAFSAFLLPVSLKLIKIIVMIYINDTPYALAQSQSLNGLLDSLNIDASKGMAVALNNNVVPREKWDIQLINDNDKIIIIKATQGG